MGSFRPGNRRARSAGYGSDLSPGTGFENTAFLNPLNPENVLPLGLSGVLAGGEVEAGEIKALGMGRAKRG